jgi:hypothetical protein
MHASEQSLRPFQLVSAIEVRPVCSVLPHLAFVRPPLGDSEAIAVQISLRS